MFHAVFVTPHQSPNVITTKPSFAMHCGNVPVGASKRLFNTLALDAVEFAP